MDFKGENHLMGHDLPLPQMSNPGVMEEDHNVGSLLRLVYSCPDPDSDPVCQEYSQQSQRQVCPELMDYAAMDSISLPQLDYL